jgi:large subunit ribosomal protein L36
MWNAHWSGGVRRTEEGIMKVRNSLRSLKSKPGSVVTRRRGRMVVVNRKNPRWNGRQG